MAASLDDHLANVMAEKNQLGKQGSTQRFHDELKKNPGMKEQATIRLNYFYSGPGEAQLCKDHISRMHKLILTEALK